MKKLSSYILSWFLPALLLLLCLPFFPKLDLAISRYFYDDTTGTFSNSPLFLWFYHYGSYPALAVGILSLTVLIFALFTNMARRWWRDALFLLLTLAVGCGLLVNVIIKENWGRPRPRQIEEFGGTAAYRPLWQPDLSPEAGQYKSFPSGHASMGFYFLAFFVLGWNRNNRYLMAAGLLLALFFGTMLSLTRIGMGAHFLSDVVGTGLIMWYTALACEAFILSPKKTLKYTLHVRIDQKTERDPPLS